MNRNEDNNKNTDPGDWSKEDPTDEYPVLDIEVMSDEAADAPSLDDTATSDNFAIASLSRLEDDIHNLQARWSTVENDLRQRDDEIVDLKSELEVRQAALKSMNNELTRAHDERDTLTAQRDEAAKNLESLQADIAERDEAIAARESEAQAAIEAHEQETREAMEAREREAQEAMEARERESQEAIELRDREIEERKAVIEKLTVERDDAQKELDSLKTQLKEQQAKVDDAAASVEAREKASNELKVKVQDLEAYIDRRKAEWHQLQENLDDYRDTLLGMEKIVEDKDAQIKRHEKEKVSLSESVLDLEQQYAELDGRRAEREAANEELQEKLVAASKDGERLKNELDRAIAVGDARLAELKSEKSTEIDDIRKEHDKIAQDLSMDLQKFRAQSEALTTDLESERQAKDDALADAERHKAQLTEAGEEVARLNEEIESERTGAEKLQAKLDEHEQEAIGLWEELKKARDKVSEADAQLLDRDGRIEQLETTTAEQLEQLGSARTELEHREARLAELREELDEQKKTVALLNRNVNRLSDLGSFVKSLDEQISRQVDGKENGTENGNGNGHGVPVLEADRPDTPCIVAIKGGQTIKYPLYKKSMTIGRSTDADIQLCWKYISREHAKIVTDGQAATIEDLGSKNGIYVNDEPVRRHELHDGDRLEIGEMRFEYVAGATMQ